MSAQATTLLPFFSTSDLWTTEQTQNRCSPSSGGHQTVRPPLPVKSPESSTLLSVNTRLSVRLIAPCLADISPTAQLRGFSSEQAEL